MRKFGRCNVLSGIASFSQVSMKHRAADLEKSRRAEEVHPFCWVESGDSPDGCQATAFLICSDEALRVHWPDSPRLHILNSTAAPPTTMSSKTYE